MLGSSLPAALELAKASMEDPALAAVEPTKEPHEERSGPDAPLLVEEWDEPLALPVPAHPPDVEMEVEADLQPGAEARPPEKPYLPNQEEAPEVDISALSNNAIQ